MTDEQEDVKQEEEETSSDSSADETSSQPDGAGAENNDGRDAEALKKELASVKEALRQEREKRQRLALSQGEEEKKPRKSSDYEDYKRFREMELQEERQIHELEIKSSFLKKYPAIQSDNDYGVDIAVVETYQDLLEGQKRRNRSPRTKDEVANLFEKAIRMVKPEIFAQRQEDDLGRGYEGMSRGMPEEKELTQEPRMNSMERQMHDYISHRLKTRGLEK